MQITIFSLPLLVVALIEGRTYRKVFAINIVLLFITFLCAYVFNYRGNLSGVLNIVISMYLYVLPLLLCQYVIDLNDKVLIKWITVSVTAILVYMLVVTFGALAEDPKIARLLAYGTNEDPYINYYRMRNVGGFGFCYALCMLSPYLTNVYNKVRKKHKKLVLVALIVLLIFSVYSQYTTFVFLSIGAIFYVILTQGKWSIKKAIALVLLITIVISFKQIVWLLANNLSLSTLASHFYDLYYIFEGEEELNRWNMYKANIGMFLQNPIFGADLTDHYRSYLTSHAHSTIFSRLSGGGIVGFGCYAGFIATAWYYLAKLKRMKRLIPVLVVYIILAFLNPVSPEISVTAFLLIPLVEYQFINKEEQLYV
ncbi:MAG: O-antigen ligase family protein [Clostridia bacterium]|nr:O-antigen ligase family protein [Clostridia bacterium]